MDGSVDGGIWPLSKRQRIADARLLEHARARMAEVQTDGRPAPLLTTPASPGAGDGANASSSAAADGAVDGAAPGRGRRLQQTAANANQAVLANIGINLAQCTWYPYGVQLIANVPGDQLLLACTGAS